MSLAIECGTTDSVAVFVEPDCKHVKYSQTKRYHFGPANYKLLKPIELEKYFQTIHDAVDSNHGSVSSNDGSQQKVTKLAVAMPGVLNDNDKKVWPRCLNCIETNLFYRN